MKALKSLFIGLFLFFVPGSLSAQVYGTPDENPGLFVSATTTSTGIAAGLIVLAVAELNRKPEKISTFLKQNGNDFQRELILGGGEILDDFAFLLGIEDDQLEAFHHFMRKNRNFLSRFTAPQHCTIENTTQLIAWIEKFYPSPLMSKSSS